MNVLTQQTVYTQLSKLAVIVERDLSAQTHNMEELCTPHSASQLGYPFCCPSCYSAAFYQGLYIPHTSSSQEAF